MLTTRREFVLGLGSLAGAACLPRWAKAAARQQQMNFAYKKIADGTYVIGDLTSGGNVLAISGAEGSIIVDAKFSHTAPQLMSDVRVLAHAQPTMLINTHHHADHSGGNWMFKGHAEVAAHFNFDARIEENLPRYVQHAEGQLERLKNANADPEAIKNAAHFVESVKGFKAEQFTSNKTLGDGVNILNHEGHQLHCVHFGPGHTDNDIVVFLPKHNIMHMGDLLFHKTYPYIDRTAKANTVGWQKSIRQAMELCNETTIVIPGHGEVTDRTGLTLQIEFFDKMRDIVGKAIKDGKSKDEVAALQPDEFKAYGLQQIRPITLGGIYEELKDSAPADKSNS